MGAEKRKRILSEASQLVSADRNASYGEPEDNFGNIAAIWNAQGVSINGGPVTAADVALMMVGMKLARLRFNPGHRDSWVDGAGYLACGGDIALPTEFADWEKLGYTTEETMKGWVRDLPDDELPDGPLSQFVKPGDKANVSELAERVLSNGWVSDNRCGSANDHEAHPYGRSSGGAVLHDPQGGHWCDGYVTPSVMSRPVDEVHRESDLDIIKRVAEKSRLKAESQTEPSGEHQIPDHLTGKVDTSSYRSGAQMKRDIEAKYDENGFKRNPIKDCPQA